MIFPMMEKSTFDKNGIKRHEFLTLISFSICNIQTDLSREKRSWGKFLTMTLTFSQQRIRRSHFQWRFYITSMVFSYFLTSKSRIRPVYSKTKIAHETYSYFQYTCKYCHFTKLTIMQLILTFCINITMLILDVPRRCSPQVLYVQIIIKNCKRFHKITVVSFSWHRKVSVQ